MKSPVHQLVRPTVNIIDQYSRQYQWRCWDAVFKKLPDLNGQQVLDMGCAIGDQSADLAARGARVLGIDNNEPFIKHASARKIPGAEFRVADIGNFDDPRLEVDGIWSSFTVAYFPRLAETIAAWSSHLRPGGWIALIDIDDLFAHEPLPPRTTELLHQFADHAFSSSKYDFQIGRKLADVLRRCQLNVIDSFAIPDQELSFNGAATSELIEAWSNRLNRMQALQRFCGEEFERVRDDFLHCLGRDDHLCAASVRCCIAHKSAS